LAPFASVAFGSLPDPVITWAAGTGTVTLTGQPAAAQRRRAAAPGAFTWTGSGATLLRAQSKPSGTGTFVLTGTAGAVRITRTITAVGGTFGVSGGPAFGGRMVAAARGVFSVTAPATGWHITRRSSTGTLQWTGNAATFVRMVSPAGATGAAVAHDVTVRSAFTVMPDAALASVTAIAAGTSQNGTRTTTVATGSATATVPTVHNALALPAAVAGAYGPRPASAGDGSVAQASVERTRWVPASSMVDANARLRRAFEVVDQSARVVPVVVTASGVQALVYPQTLLDVDTTAGARAVTLPAPATVPGFRVQVVKTAGANALTVNTVSVATRATFVSTGAAWRQVG